MTRARSGQLEDWEVGLVKRLWLSGDYNKQQIQAFFTRPDRSINQARITEIIREERHFDIQTGSVDDLDRFLEAFQKGMSTSVEESRAKDPLAESNLLTVLQLTDSDPPELGVEESDSMEWKKSFNWSDRSEYARTIAGFANRRGGYLIFGIDPDTKRVVGIPQKELGRHDPADMSRFFDSCIQPAPRWKGREVNLRGQNIGVIFVYESDTKSKPLICLKQFGNRLRQGDVFYRYTGRTDRIGYPEMQQLLKERDSAIQQEWMNLVKRIEANGIENVAILNTVTGLVEGRGGAFLIDEALIEKLEFIREGEFSEQRGAPTLKLIGELETVSQGHLRPVRKVPEQITWTSSIRDFASQAQLDEPMAYVRALCHLQAEWVPVYYYVQQAKQSIADAVTALESEEATRPTSQGFQIERLETRKLPSNVPQRHSQFEFRELIQEEKDFDLSDPDVALGWLRATSTLESDEIDLEFLLPLLLRCSELYSRPNADRNLPAWIRTAACVIDYQVFGRPLYDDMSDTHVDSQNS